jgi:hypothetical protein
MSSKPRPVAVNPNPYRKSNLATQESNESKPPSVESKTTLHLTRHAKERAIERLGWSEAEVHDRLRLAWWASRQVPERVLRRASGQRHVRRKGAPRFRVFQDVVLVCRRRTVVTVWRLDRSAFSCLRHWFAVGHFFFEGCV